ncbi:hypothetical protein ADL22_08715 [Streptomyces sp. NRRL F-4489]|nr:hypothetical protein ADL22_08715 [Streptomyces sp. NRRL F-4489]
MGGAPAVAAPAAAVGAAPAVAAPAARGGASPDPVVPGERVSITDGGRCGAVPGATAVSELFGTVALRPGARGMAAEVPLGEAVEPGRYRVTIECGRGGTRHQDVVTVAEGRAEGVGMAQAAGGAALLALAALAYLLRRGSTSVG